MDIPRNHHLKAFIHPPNIFPISTSMAENRSYCLCDISFIPNAVRATANSIFISTSRSTRHGILARDALARTISAMPRQTHDRMSAPSVHRSLLGIWRIRTYAYCAISSHFCCIFSGSIKLSDIQSFRYQVFTKAGRNPKPVHAQLRASNKPNAPRPACDVSFQ